MGARASRRRSSSRHDRISPDATLGRRERVAHVKPPCEKPSIRARSCPRKGRSAPARLGGILLAVVAAGPRLRAALRPARVRLRVRARPRRRARPASTSGTARRRARAPRSDGRRRVASSPASSARAAALSAATLSLPLVLGSPTPLRVRNCSLAAGLGVLRAAAAAERPLRRHRRRAGGPGDARRRRGRLLAFALPAASILWTLLRLYRDPPVFAFDPFGGYFPGPIYDEALRPPLTLLLFRVANLVWAATAIVLALAVHREWPRSAPLAPAQSLAAALPLVAASVVLYATGGRLGFHIARARSGARARSQRDDRALRRSLRPRQQEPHRRGAGGRGSRVSLPAARQTFGVEPKLPITVWDFPDAEVKKALVGAGDTLYAKPWTREMFVQERFPSKRLRHEMAHVFAGAFGDPFFGVALSWRWTPLPHPALAMGLVEGIAEAADADDPWGDATIHQEAAAMIAAGLAPPLADVVGAGFSTLAGARAYTLAGSFSAFLLSTRGADKLRALYRSAGNFSDVYRIPLADLEREWRHFLAAQPLTTAAARPRHRGVPPGRHLRPRLRARARGAGRRGAWPRGERSGARGGAPAIDLPRRSERAALPAGAGARRGGGRGRVGGADRARPPGARRHADRPAARRGGVADGGHRLRRARLRQRRDTPAARARSGGDRRRPAAGAGQASGPRQPRRARHARPCALRRHRRARRRPGADLLPVRRVRPTPPGRSPGTLPARTAAHRPRRRARAAALEPRVRRRTAQPTRAHGRPWPPSSSASVAA